MIYRYKSCQYISIVLLAFFSVSRAGMKGLLGRLMYQMYNTCVSSRTGHNLVVIREDLMSIFRIVFI